MSIICKTLVHRWQIVGIHIGQQIADHETVATITYHCTRCGAETTDTLRDCWLSVDVRAEHQWHGDEDIVRDCTGGA
jgi:hypothetical protein